MKHKRQVFLVAGVSIIAVAAFLTVFLLYPNEHPDNFVTSAPAEPTPRKLQLDHENLLIPENEGGGTNPHLFGASNTKAKLIFIQNNTLTIADIDTSGKTVGESRPLGNPEHHVKNFAFAQAEDTAFLAYERINDSRTEFVLEKINANGQSEGTSVIYSANQTRSLLGEDQETFATPHLFMDQATLYLLTPINDNTSTQQLRLRAFDFNLTSIAESKDIHTGDRPLAAGRQVSGVTTEDGFWILTTQRFGGADLCPQPDETTQTEIAALHYDKEWNLVGAKKLTRGNRITHHPLVAYNRDRKIHTIFYMHDRESVPSCTNNDIPIEGELMHMTFNENFAEINKTELHDAKNGTAGPAHFVLTDEGLQLVYAFRRQTDVSAPTAIQFARYVFEQTKTRNQE